MNPDSGIEPEQGKVYHGAVLWTGVKMKAVQAALFTIHSFLQYQGCKSLSLLQYCMHCPSSKPATLQTRNSRLAVFKVRYITINLLKEANV